MIVAGNANKVMAIDLGVSERTIEIYRARVWKRRGRVRLRISSSCICLSLSTGLITGPS